MIFFILATYHYTSPVVATDGSKRERAVRELLDAQVAVRRDRVLALVVELVPLYLRSGGT